MLVNKIFKSAVDIWQRFCITGITAASANIFTLIKIHLMENSDHKKDESVKAGMKIEAGKNSHSPALEINETDPDDRVHESKDEMPDANVSEQDVDDLVHTHLESTPVNELEEIDADDVIHEDQKEMDDDDRGSD
jgi:hypothetical protein